MIKQDRVPTICMIAYTDYPFDARVRREAESLAEEGFRVLCLTPSDGNGGRSHCLKGVEVRELNMPKYQGKSSWHYMLSYAAFLWHAFWACNRLLRQGIDAVHVHNMPDFLVFAALLPRLAGKKVILDIHDSVPETFACKFPRSSRLFYLAMCLEERLSTLIAHKVICVNHPQRDRLIGRGIPPGKMLTLLNSPDHRLFAKRRSRENGQPGFRLIYHGTMAERLGVDLIIRATALLQDRVEGLELHLWGHGDDLNAFQELVTQLGIEKTVHFKPQGVQLHELPENLAGMDLGVVGNRRNIATELMLPVKLLEYVALGIPVVAPRLRAIEHYFSDDMVTFYEPGDAQAMADAILALHQDASRRRAQAARAQSFIDRFGWEEQEAEFISLYQSLLSA